MSRALHTSRDHGFPDVGNGDAPCCMGSAVYGPGRCTCWAPVYDLEQQEPRPGQMQPRTKCCGDCAFRMGSPERSGDSRMAHSSPGELEQLVGGSGTFACHVGMRRVIAWRHPSGAQIEAESGCYAPPILAGVAYRADGRPADVCAGLTAMRAGSERELARGGAA